MAIAANKADLYEEEKISEEDGRKYANEIGAIFSNTSAINGNGITELFAEIGKKLLILDNKDKLHNDSQKLFLNKNHKNKNKNKKKKSSFC